MQERVSERAMGVQSTNTCLALLTGHGVVLGGHHPSKLGDLNDPLLSSLPRCYVEAPPHNHGWKFQRGCQEIK